jgi:hypothetical protein
MWIKATIDVLNGGQNGPALALETIQGIIILSFVLCNMGGVSLPYRSLISTGLLLSRELGLHRIDHESNAATANIIRAEVGCRVWWYLIATDWYVFFFLPSPFFTDLPRPVDHSNAMASGCWPGDMEARVKAYTRPTRAAYDGHKAAQHRQRRPCR